MEFPKFIKQYRILEKRKAGDTTFFPQERYKYWVWQYILRTGYDYLKEEFDTIAEAEEFLYDFQRGETARAIVKKEEWEETKRNKTTSHPFNAVFYKLKKKDYE